ncbi:MAG: hypothetical protein ACLTFW_28090 [Klebsiella pneumoniae]
MNCRSGIHFRSLTDSIDTDTRRPLLLSCMSALAEMERN